DLTKIRPRADVDDGVGARGDRGVAPVAAGVLEERHLADEVAPRQDRDGLPSLAHGGIALHEDHELVTPSTLLHEHPAGRHGKWGQMASDDGPLGPVGLSE